MSRSSVPPPVTVVMYASDAWLPARMEAVEEATEGKDPDKDRPT